MYYVVMDVQFFGVRVEFFVGGVVWVIDQFIVDIKYGGGVVVFEDVIYYFNVVVIQGDEIDVVWYY